MCQWQSVLNHGQFLHSGHWEVAVLDCCLFVAVTTFQDKFASLWQVNNPNSKDKIQICCFDMYLVRFLANFVCFCEFCGISQIAGLLEICISTTAQFASPQLHNTAEALYLPVCLIWLEPV